MTLTQKLLSLLALVTLVTISSCNDDEGTGQLSKDQAKGKLAEFNTNASNDIKDVADADGIKAIQEFFSLVDTDDPFDGGRVSTDRNKVRAFFHERGRAFKSIFVKPGATPGRTKEDGSFDYAANLGIYEWNPEIGEQGGFEKIGDSEIIFIKFPSEGSATNNAELRLLDYSEVSFYDEESQETRYEAEKLDAELRLNGATIASLFLELNWDDHGFPLSGDVVFEVAPWKATLSFDDSGSLTSTINASFQKNSQVLLGVNVTAFYSDESKSEESLTKLTGGLQLKNLLLEGTVDAEAANATEVDWTKVFQLSVFADGQKLGDVILVDENGEGVAYLQYADGSKEKLETVIKPVIDELEELTEELDDNG